MSSNYQITSSEGNSKHSNVISNEANTSSSGRQASSKQGSSSQKQGSSKNYGSNSASSAQHANSSSGRRAQNSQQNNSSQFANSNSYNGSSKRSSDEQLVFNQGKVVYDANCVIIEESKSCMEISEMKNIDGPPPSKMAKGGDSKIIAKLSDNNINSVSNQTVLSGDSVNLSKQIQQLQHELEAESQEQRKKHLLTGSGFATKSLMQSSKLSSPDQQNGDFEGHQQQEQIIPSSQQQYHDEEVDQQPQQSPDPMVEGGAQSQRNNDHRDDIYQESQNEEEQEITEKSTYDQQNQQN